MHRRFCIEAGDTDRPALWLAEVFDAERCPSWVILTTVCSGQLTLWMKLIREVTIRWVRCVFIDRALWAHADTKSPSNYANSDYCVSPELCSCLLWPDTKKSTATFNHCFRRWDRTCCWLSESKNRAQAARRPLSESFFHRVTGLFPAGTCQPVCFYNKPFTILSLPPHWSARGDTGSVTDFIMTL